MGVKLRFEGDRRCPAGKAVWTSQKNNLSGVWRTLFRGGCPPEEEHIKVKFGK